MEGHKETIDELQNIVEEHTRRLDNLVEENSRNKSCLSNKDKRLRKIEGRYWAVMKWGGIAILILITIPIAWANWHILDVFDINKTSDAALTLAWITTLIVQFVAVGMMWIFGIDEITKWGD